MVRATSTWHTYRRIIEEIPMIIIRVKRHGVSQVSKKSEIENKQNKKKTYGKL